MHVVTMHEYKIIMTVLIESIQQLMVLYNYTTLYEILCKLCTKYCSCEVVRLVNFSKLGKFLLKLRVHHSGKFAPREITHIYMKAWLRYKGKTY